jgi:hypothetical protein
MATSARVSVLVRHRDPSGVGGTGVVAEGVTWSDGRTDRGGSSPLDPAGPPAPLPPAPGSGYSHGVGGCCGAVAAPAVYLTRLNAAGFCRQCLTQGCADPQCVDQWRGIVWTACTTCCGSGSADYALALANGGPDLATTDCDRCTDGVLEQHIDNEIGTGRDQHQRQRPDLT